MSDRLIVIDYVLVKRYDSTVSPLDVVSTEYRSGVSCAFLIPLELIMWPMPTLLPRYLGLCAYGSPPNSNSAADPHIPELATPGNERSGETMAAEINRRRRHRPQFPCEAIYLRLAKSEPAGF